MDYLMGIDLGSTSLKAVVYDLDGRMVAAGARPTEKCHPDADHPEWTVWQPEQIWSGVSAAIRDALAGVDDLRALRAVAVTGMGMDGLPVDSEGRWLYPFISWHDPRTAPQLAWWADHVGLERTFAIGGNPVWPINSALRIRWMMENQPQIMARAEKWLLIEDFVNYLLTGRRVTDYSMASCTMLFDQRKLQWSEELIGASGIERRLLCEVLPAGTLIGQVTAEASQATGLPQGTPVVLGGHDHLCGALPVGAFWPGRVLDVVGTWEIVTAITGQPVLDLRLQRAGMTVQAHVARNCHATWGANVAAEMLEWYVRHYGCQSGEQSSPGEGNPWDHLMAQAAASPPGARGVMFLPHMSGAGCPMVDPKSLGALVGLSTRATPGDVVRALVEGLNYQFLDILSAMEESLGIRPERIVAVGGGTRNRLWMQTKADMAARPIEVPQIEEATPLGAALLAGIGVGLYRDEEEAFRRVYRPGVVYQPDPGRSQQYAAGFAIYRQLYPALAGVSRQLFDRFLNR